MTSRIRLYNVPEMTEENNNVIENITTFLNGFEPVFDLQDFQFQRLESSKVIKINKPQSITYPKANEFNYCRIETTFEGSKITSGHPAFYYVQEVSQVDQNTVRLAMKLDVLNTFFTEWKNKFAEGTFIARAHEKRFALHSSDSSSVTLANLFDRRPEGDNPPLITRPGSVETIYDEKIEDENDKDLKFYLIYRTANDGRPCVDLAASKQLKIGEGSTGQAYVLNTSQMVAGRYYYLIGEIDFSIAGSESTYTTTGTTGIWSGFSNATRTYSGEGFLVFWKESIGVSDYVCFKFISSSDDVNAESGSFYELQNMPNLTDGDKRFRCTKTDGTAVITISKGLRLYYSTTITYDQAEILNFQYTQIDAGTYAPEYLGAISQLDKTDSRLVKVVECPYCPVEFTFDHETDVYDFEHNEFPTVSENENPRFLRSYDVGSEFVAPYIKGFDLSDLAFQTATKTQLANPSQHFLTDPKSLTSPYFALTFYYDNFAKQLKLEDYEYKKLLGRDSFRINLRYKQSNSVSSALCFSFSDVPLFSAYSLGITEENFPNYLIANRNNEVTLFSSEYLNYMRNGYNYDKKKMEEQLAQQGMTAAIQAISSIISFFLSPTTGGLSAATGVGLAAAAVSSASNLAYSSSKSGEELAQKVNLLKSQGYSVSSVDDLSLFNYYQGNKIKKAVYEVSEKESARIDSRFRYFGYAIDTYGDPYAEGYMNNRHAFNYLKVDAVWRQGTIYAIPPEYLDEISEKLRGGVTIWHYPFLSANSLKMDRDVENIEEEIFQAIQ